MSLQFLALFFHKFYLHFVYACLFLGTCQGVSVRTYQVVWVSPRKLLLRELHRQLFLNGAFSSQRQREWPQYSMLEFSQIQTCYVALVCGKCLFLLAKYWSIAIEPAPYRHLQLRRLHQRWWFLKFASLTRWRTSQCQNWRIVNSILINSRSWWVRTWYLRNWHQDWLHAVSLFYSFDSFWWDVQAHLSALVVVATWSYEENCAISCFQTHFLCEQNWQALVCDLSSFHFRLIRRSIQCCSRLWFKGRFHCATSFLSW